MNSALHRIVAFVFVVMFVCSASTELRAQQSNERVLKKQTVKKVAKSIEKLARKGYVPMDAIVDCNGRRAMFTIRLVKPPTTSPWFAKFDLTDAQFESIFERNKSKKLRIAWHEVYVVKEETKHAAIWHYDASFNPITDEEANGKTAPQPRPIGTIWKPDSRIPTTASGHPAFASFETQAIEFIRANQMPALSVAVSLKGKMLYQGAFGYSDLDRKTKVTPEQPFRSASLSRIVTVVAALQLVDRGKLKLNTPVYPMLGVKPWRANSVDARSSTITVLNLLQETAGHDQSQSLDPGQSPRSITKTMKLKTLITPQHTMEYMLSKPLAYAPGTDSRTSAYTYLMLGRVIEKASGQPYEDYVLENIAKPLGLRSLRMSRIDPAERIGDEVVHVERAGRFYSKLAGSDAGKWVRANHGGIHFGLLDSSHGWMLTPSDMLKLMTAIQASPSPILSDDSKVLMTARPPHEKSDKEVWKGCVLSCRMTSNGITLWRFTQDVYCSAGLVCFSSNGLSYCFMFNTHRTVAGDNPRNGFDEIVNKEANKVWRLLEKR